MRPKRLTFLSQFVLILACAGGAFFAWTRGIPQFIYASDASMMTSVIAALFVATSAWLSWQAWNADIIEPVGLFRGESVANAAFGHLAEKLSIRCGLMGSGIGIMLIVKAQLASANPLGALQTCFITMICGVAAASIIALMTFSLENGIARARR